MEWGNHNQGNRMGYRMKEYEGEREGKRKRNKETFVVEIIIIIVRWQKDNMQKC